jgi:preprotein translocase subunit SecE
MKVINKISQILATVFSVAALVLFFVPFANITTNGTVVSPVGFQLALGTNVTLGETAYNMGMSAHIFFVLLLTFLATVMSGFAFKAKGLRYGSSAVALISAVYMWVIALNKASQFVDPRPFQKVSAIEHTNAALFLAIAITLFAVFAIAYLLIDDYLEAKANKTKTIWQRIVLFLRDNKSEVKKIVWPSLRDVLKNTFTVLVMCLVIGALIWVVDFGLGSLIELILGAK